MKTALLLVDLQNDYLTRVPGRAALEKSVTSLLASARDAGWPVLHVRTGGAPMPHRKDQPMRDAAAPESLREIANEDVFYKRFFSAFENENLEASLKEKGINRVVIAGVHTHACVRSAVTDAYARGFDVFVPTDAVGSYDSVHAASTLEWLNGRAATCAPMSSLFGGDAPALHTEELKPISLADLRAWHDRLSARRNFWIEAIGNAVHKSKEDAAGEVAYGLSLLSHIIETFSNEETFEGGVTRFRPRGLIGVITPWNNPFALPIAKIGAALAYGNTVLWKPAPQADALSGALIQGLGGVSIVRGGADAGRAVAQKADAVSFTGSTAAGRELAALCARGMKPLQAETGGNNAAIVCADADLAAAAKDLAVSMFSFAGQRCTAIRRVIVERAVYKDFSALLEQEAKSIAPMKIISGETQAPKIVFDPSLDSPAWKDELFAPTVACIAAETFDEALKLYNGVEQGLLGALYTQDESKQEKFLNEAEAGILSLNAARPKFSAQAPFSGWKSSSFGLPEHGRWDRDFYTRTQAVYNNAEKR